MSLLPTCKVCDALLRGYGAETRCERCSEPCPTCCGDVGHCRHPLRPKAAPYVRMSIDLTEDGGRVAA